MQITDRDLADREGASKYPFADLQINQCLEVAVEDEKALSNLRSAASYWAKKYGMELSVRRISDGLYGVWRLK